jgi:hypothetical protein
LFRPLWEFVKRNVITAVNIAAVLGVCYLLPIPSNTWLWWIVSSAVFVAIAAIFTVGFNFVFYRTEMKNAVKVVKAIGKKRKKP